MKFSAVILAGGKSSRMGRDKAWLEMDRQPLLARQIQVVREAGATEVFISGRAGVDYSGFQLPVLLDACADQGPLGGIERALSVCAASHLLVLAVDLPQMSAQFLKRLRVHCTETEGIIPALDEELEPLVAIYLKACLPLAQAALANGERAVRKFALNCRSEKRLRELSVAPEEVVNFTNWNRPDDFRAD